MDRNTLLQKYNLKATPQRLEIIDILTTNGHVNIEEIYSSLQKKFPSVSLSTIYKNINTMREKGFLSEVKINGQKSVYELIKDEHSHAVCIRCNQVIDVKIDTSDIIHQATEVSKYKLNKSSVIFQGFCVNCK